MKDLISEFLHQRVPVNLSVKDRLPAESKIIIYTESKAQWQNRGKTNRESQYVDEVAFPMKMSSKASPEPVRGCC